MARGSLCLLPHCHLPPLSGGTFLPPGTLSLTTAFCSHSTRIRPCAPLGGASLAPDSEPSLLPHEPTRTPAPGARPPQNPELRGRLPSKALSWSHCRLSKRESQGCRISGCPPLGLQRTHPTGTVGAQKGAPFLPSPTWPLALDCALAEADLSLSPVSVNWLWEDPPDIQGPDSVLVPRAARGPVCVYLSLLLGCTERRRECQ